MNNTDEKQLQLNWDLFLSEIYSFTDLENLRKFIISMKDEFNKIIVKSNFKNEFCLKRLWPLDMAISEIENVEFKNERDLDLDDISEYSGEWYCDFLSEKEIFTDTEQSEKKYKDEYSWRAYLNYVNEVVKSVYDILTEEDGE